ncbi:TetR/AcrR family transcriptional regulator [Nocardia sp. FBN12]|uniref:TetR/AcrR family transcriptional regulator n=1 Tax=Nocardia sp. FBN12 TaxID=3419766 RepID=UPI003D055099
MSAGEQRHDKISTRRIARRNQLLDIAREAFVARGYHGVTMALLARRADVTNLCSTTTSPANSTSI